MFHDRYNFICYFRLQRFNIQHWLFIIYTRYDPNVRGRGREAVFKTDNVEQGGGGQKVFGQRL